MKQFVRDVATALNSAPEDVLKYVETSSLPKDISFLYFLGLRNVLPVRFASGCAPVLPSMSINIWRECPEISCVLPHLCSGI